MNAPTTMNDKATTEVDPFADAAFVSTSPNAEAGASFQPEDSLEQAELIFKGRTWDLYPYGRPLCFMPLSNFDGSDLFGAFTSHTDQVSAESNLKTAKEGSLDNMNQKPSAETTPSKKGTFQVKSGILADSLSRGLIDLNITAPKKMNLANIGIVGGISDGSDEKEKGPLATHMGRAMGSGSGLGRSLSGFTYAVVGGGDEFFSSLSQQQQFGSFKKRFNPFVFYTSSYCYLLIFFHYF
ncbi:hypothetical protein IFM89_009704 [Coptis chinensis]|uniref:Uncharacterized protein n=1 Tax=Coptis chinensis TaxID=261450 RepID=A0A835HV40_9MAGN|nr:hypothetical protein IFM89_009704 [Coptis chinensis]